MVNIDKDQVFIFTKAELALIKATFADNDELLYAIRSVMLQVPITDQEQELIKRQLTPEVFAILKKKLLPDFTGDYPLTQIPDFYASLTQDLKTCSVKDMEPLFDAKLIEEKYLAQQLDIIGEYDFTRETPITLTELKNLEGKDGLTRFVHATARNYLLGYIDPMLRDLKIIAGHKEESPEDQEKRMTRASSQ